MSTKQRKCFKAAVLVEEYMLTHKLVFLDQPFRMVGSRMEDCVDRVGGARFVTKLDLLKGY